MPQIVAAQMLQAERGDDLVPVGGGSRLLAWVSDPFVPPAGEDDLSEPVVARAARVGTVAGQRFPRPGRVTGKGLGRGDERDVPRTAESGHLLGQSRGPSQMAFTCVDDGRGTYDQRTDRPLPAPVEERGQVVHTPGVSNADLAFLLNHVVAAEGDDQPIVGIGQCARCDLLPTAAQDILGGVAPDPEIESRDITAGGLEYPANPTPVLRITDALDKGVADEAHA